MSLSVENCKNLSIKFILFAKVCFKRKSIPGIDKKQVLFSKFNKRLPYY